MTHRIWFCLLALSIGNSQAADPPGPLTAKKEAWQKKLDSGKFSFPESPPSVLASVTQFRGDCEIHMIFDPKKRGFRFKFERDGKEIVTLSGHTESSFRTGGKVLYFAHNPTTSFGCKVSAHDLTNGKKLWETTLSAVGAVSHFGYDNDVMLHLTSLDKLDKEGEGCVYITGRESYGDYIEILDRRTGDVLARKVYRQGFGRSK